MRSSNFQNEFKGRSQCQGTKILERMTRRRCVSKVAKIYFYIAGKFMAITTAMKLDPHKFVV